MMHCPLEDKPTWLDRIVTISISILTWIAGCIVLTIISHMMGSPVSLKALIFIYIALGVSNMLPAISKWLRSNYFWNKWERKQRAK